MLLLIVSSFAYKSIINTSYELEIFESYIVPTLVNRYGIFSDGDGIIIANYLVELLNKFYKDELLTQQFKFMEYNLNNTHLYKLIGMLDFDIKEYSNDILNQFYSEFMIRDVKGNNKKIEIIKQVSGYSMIMFSRWDLIKNFCEKEQINYHDLKDKKLWIKENSREFPSIILENEYGTHIFSGFCISCLKFINSFIEHNINVFLIDSFLKNDQWTLDTLNLYTKLLDNLENLNLINDLIKKEITINLPDQTSISFLGNKSDLLYLPKEKNNE